MPKTLNQWLTKARTALLAKGIASADSDSLIMLCYSLKKDTSYIFAHPETLLTIREEKHAQQLLKRRMQGEPIAYLTGEKEFYGRSFKSDARGLIPRWETEVLVEAALTWLRQHLKPQLVVDIGTGSGIIILTLATECPNHHFIATDISREAVNLAQENAKRLTRAAIKFYVGNLGEPLLSQFSGKVTLLTANLPYIATDLLKNLDQTITYFEPNNALDGGNDGLDLYRQFLPQAKRLVAPNGLMLLEHEYNQGEDLQNLAKRYFAHGTFSILQDGLGHNRVLKVVNHAPE